MRVKRSNYKFHTLTNKLYYKWHTASRGSRRWGHHYYDHYNINIRAEGQRLADLWWIDMTVDVVELNVRE